MGRRKRSPQAPALESVPAAPPSPPRALVAAAGLLAAAAVFAAYSNHFHNGFHFDDNHVIVNNIYLRSLKNVPLYFKTGEAFSSLPSNATYRPLTTLSFALDYAMGHGLNPVAFHLSQWAMHMALGVLLFFFYRRLLELAGFRRPFLALFGAALFCVHRANTETVNYLSSISDVLSTLGVVASFVVYQRWPRQRRLFLWLVPAALGALAKPSAVMFAPLFVLYLALFPGERDARSNGRRLSSSALVIPAFLMAGVLYVLQSKLRGRGLQYSLISPMAYFRTQVFAWTHYLRLFLFPLGLSADSDWQVIPHWYDSRIFAGAVISAGLFAAAIVYARRRPAAGRGALFGILWFYLALAPTSSFVALSEMVNEHRLYFPYIGLIAAVLFVAGDWLGRVPQLAKPTMIGAFLLLAAHAGGTYQRNTVWATDEALWKDVTETSPGNGRGWMNYGLIFMARGDWANARACFEKAQANAPNYDFLEVNFGILEGASGRPADAERHFQRAITLNLNPAMSHFYFARWLHQVGRDAEAADHLRQSLAVSPADLEARHLLMNVYKALHDDSRYCALARETLAIAPGDPDATSAVASCAGK
jgi:tetratricopeptide (TPR) repeat protein